MINFSTELFERTTSRVIAGALDIPVTFVSSGESQCRLAHDYNQIVEIHNKTNEIKSSDMINWSGDFDAPIVHQFKDFYDEYKLQLCALYAYAKNRYFPFSSPVESVSVSLLRDNPFWAWVELLTCAHYASYPTKDGLFIIKTGGNHNVIYRLVPKTAGTKINVLIGPVLLDSDNDSLGQWAIIQRASSEFITPQQPFSFDDFKRRSLLVSKTINKVINAEMPELFIQDQINLESLVKFAFISSVVERDLSIEDGTLEVSYKFNYTQLAICQSNNIIYLNEDNNYTYNQASLESFTRRMDELNRRIQTRMMLVYLDEVSRLNMLLARLYKNLISPQRVLSDILSDALEQVCFLLKKHIICDTIIISIYKYESGSGCLEPVKVANFNGINKETPMELIANYKDNAPHWNLENSTEMLTAVNSIAYASIIAKAPFVVGMDTKLFFKKNTFCEPPNMLRMGEHKTVAAVPIIVHGRVWGTIEIGTVHRNGFGAAEVIFLRHIAEIIATEFHQKNIDKIIYEELAVLNNNTKELDQTAKILCELFLCEEAVIWRPKAGTENQWFFAEGRHQREISINDEFCVNDDNNVIGRMIKEGKRWFAGTVGEAPLNGAWLEKSITKPLQKGGALALWVIYDINGEIVAGISLSSRLGEFGEYFEVLARDISAHMALEINRQEMLAEQKTKSYQFGHILKDILAQTKNYALTLEGYIEGEPDNARKTKRVKMASDNIKMQFEGLMSLYNGLMEIKDKPGDKIPMQSFIGECIEVVIEGFSRALRSNKIILQKYIQNQYKYRVEVPPLAITTMVAPLLHNAIKYSSVKSDKDRKIIVSIDEVERGIELSIVSRGRSSGLDTEREIWRYGARGKNTIDENDELIDGGGFGLNIVAKVAKIYHVKKDYKEAAANEWVEHTVRLLFPIARRF